MRMITNIKRKNLADLLIMATPLWHSITACDDEYKRGN